MKKAGIQRCGARMQSSSNAMHAGDDVASLAPREDALPMPGSGIIYFNTGDGCLARMCVSMYSLRKVYAGAVTLLSQGMLPDWVRRQMDRLCVAIVDVPIQEVSSRTMKASLWRYSPYKITLFLDSDTLVLQNPTPLLGEVERHGFVVTQFSNWITTGRRMRTRIMAWRPVLDEGRLERAMGYGKAINTGVVGWRDDASILIPWEHHARIGWSAGCTRRLIDELACQVLLHEHPHAVVSDRWNCSVRYGVSDQPAIIHYHGNKHLGNEPKCSLWRNCHEEYEKWVKSDHDSWNSVALNHVNEITRDDITIVTVVNNAYLHKLKANWPVWMKTKGLREQRYIVFALGSPDLDFIKSWPRAQVVEWPTPDHGRSACLGAFVFGVARHVQTDYWMKLDCDTHPKSDVFQWPDYRKHTITAHRWGYTRVKGDPLARQHWLNTLDDWWGDVPIFPRNIPVGKYRHPRIASFCAIEKTDFTRRLAARCGEALPVPSQDTTGWYVATRWGESICRVNMKSQMQPG